MELTGFPYLFSSALMVLLYIRRGHAVNIWRIDARRGIHHHTKRHKDYGRKPKQKFKEAIIEHVFYCTPLKELEAQSCLDYF